MQGETHHYQLTDSYFVIFHPFIYSIIGIFGIVRRRYFIEEKVKIV